MIFEWYEDALVFCVFIRFQLLLFRTNSKKGDMDNDGFRHCYDNFFRKLHTECYLITAVQNWHQHFERYRTIEYRTWISVRVKSFIKNLVNIIKQKSVKVSQKILVLRKSDLALQRTLHQSIPRFTYFILFLFPQT